MSESLVLSNPINPPAPPPVTQYSVVRLLIERIPYARIVITVINDSGVRTEAIYSDEFGGTVAMSLISALNTANLSIKSLQKRILERLVTDGKLPAGNVSGTPD